jgi:A/G-specific adenine glycosylase
MTVQPFHQAVLAWFDRFGRKHLPWQLQPTPYRVWISEIMLQQTQVSTVIPYYQRFMDRFPSLTDLARADEADLMQHWAGLGYYARARNLHRAAVLVLERHRGELPANLDALTELPGIGRSTAGAILSIAFGIRAPILDGNVKRVLARHAGIEGWTGEAAVLSRLWTLADERTPTHRVAHYTQAMMDLGATVCTRAKPACEDCPLREDCVARATGTVDRLPTPKPRKLQPVKNICLLALQDPAGRFWLERRPPTGIWGGLWSLPEFADRHAAADWCRAHGIQPVNLEALPQRRHTFSHFHLDYQPIVGRLDHISQVHEAASGDWRMVDRRTALPAPVRQLLEFLQNRSNRETP